MVNLDSLQLLETQVGFKCKHTFKIGRTSKMISKQQRVTVGNTNTHTHTHTHTYKESFRGYRVVIIDASKEFICLS